MAKYRFKEPVVIEAVQLTWENWNEICDFIDVGSLEDNKATGTDKDIEGNQLPDGGPGLLIPTSEGVHVAMPNDWIIQGVAGEFFPCKPDKFTQTYEEVSNG